MAGVGRWSSYQHNKLASSLLYLADSPSPIIVDLPGPLPLELLQKFLHPGERLSSWLHASEVDLSEVRSPGPPREKMSCRVMQNPQATRTGKARVKAGRGPTSIPPSWG